MVFIMISHLESVFQTKHCVKMRIIPMRIFSYINSWSIRVFLLFPSANEKPPFLQYLHVQARLRVPANWCSFQNNIEMAL